MGSNVRTVFFYSQGALTEGVPKELIGTPYIIDEDGQADQHLNEYFLARRNGDWAATIGNGGITAELEGRTVLRASPKYLRNRAYQLDVLRRWLRSEAQTYAMVTDSLLDRFAEDLEEGLVSKTDGGLLPSTVNQYLTAAIDFLRYSALVGWRGPLKLAMRRSRRNGGAGRPIVLRRVNPAELRTWYTEEQITEFIDEFETATGKLAARIMFYTGLRISEVQSLTMAMIPSLKLWDHDPAARRIRIKGKFAKTRLVPINRELLVDIHAFINFDRRIIARRLKQPSDVLLIAAAGSGQARSARSIQKGFVRAREAANFKALSPHILRHHYAAHFLLRAWHGKTARLAGHGPAADTSLATSLLQGEIIALKYALGHERIETTMKYLHALFYLSGSSLPEAYSTELDPEDAF